MTIQTAKVKNGKIVLPKRLWELWEEADVSITSGKDKIVIERTKGQIFDRNTEKKLRRLGKKVTQKDIESAVRWARAK